MDRIMRIGIAFMAAAAQRVIWVAWGVGLGAVLIGLGWQVSYAEAAAACASGQLLQLCAGPLDGWLMPVSVAAGLVLVAVAAWRLRGR